MRHDPRRGGAAIRAGLLGLHVGHMGPFFKDFLTVGTLIFVDGHSYNAKNGHDSPFFCPGPSAVVLKFAAPRREPAMNCPRKLGLGGLGFTHALLQTFSATMTAAIQFLFTLNFLVSHDVLHGGDAPINFW